MGVVQKPEYHMHWTRQHNFFTPIFSRLMRRDRFEQLHKMVHFSDPENKDSMDSLRKLKFFLEYLIVRYKENDIPEEDLAIDEYLSLWKGRLSFRIYIPTKRERYGVKICFVKAKQVIY